MFDAVSESLFQPPRTRALPLYEPHNVHHGTYQNPLLFRRLNPELRTLPVSSVRNENASLRFKCQGLRLKGQGRLNPELRTLPSCEPSASGLGSVCSMLSLRPCSNPLEPAKCRCMKHTMFSMEPIRTRSCFPARVHSI